MPSATGSSTLWAASVLLALAGLAPEPKASPVPPVSPLWRQRGRDTLACITCHTASGAEIWLSKIPEADIKRRASRHLTKEESSQLACSMAAMRTGRALPGPIPFAPPDSPLPGGTAAERDQAFAEHLRKDGFPLLTGEIQTVADAKRAAAALTARPLNQVPVGLPLDPLSRDPFRGLDEPGLNDWIPDLPAGVAPSFLRELSNKKRAALNCYEEFLLKGSVTLPPLDARHHEHPIWALGSYVRGMKDWTGREFGLSEAQAASLGVSVVKPLEFDQMALNWFWIGWTLNPDLTRMAKDPQARFGGYMSELLNTAGPYPFHSLYFASRRPLEWRATQGGALQPDWAAFVNQDALARFEPKGDSEAFLSACRGLLRMTCLLVSDDLAHGKVSRNPTGARQQISALWKYVEPRDSASRNAVTSGIVVHTLAALKPLADRQNSPVKLKSGSRQG